jgi:glycosyltransferase involved in cell wall biosynthesis
MMSNSTRVAVILPLREHFRVADAGAVALTVKDFIEVSRYRSEMLVYGGFAEHYPDIRYHQVLPSFWKLFGQNLAYAKACSRDLAQHGVQLVEVHNRVQLALRIKAADPALKVALYLHNDPYTMGGLETAAQRLAVLQRVDMIYSVSQYVQARLLVGVDPSFAAKCQVIYNALPPNPEPAFEPRQPWIVYAGRFVPQKGVLELAKAFATLMPQHPDWKVVFLGARGFGHEAGKTPYEQAVYAELSHVGAQVEFRGHVQHDEVLEVLSQSAIAVSASVAAEAFGRTTLEAMNAGCAVVTSNWGGLKEVAGDAAVVVDPVTPATLAAAIDALIRDPAQRLACAERCRQHAIQAFALAAEAEKLDVTRDVLLGQHSR